MIVMEVPDYVTLETFEKIYGLTPNHKFGTTKNTGYGLGCNKCGGVDEPYMIQDLLWHKISSDNIKQMLCLKCVEILLNRKLTIEDFRQDVPLNFGLFGFHHKDYINGQTS